MEVEVEICDCNDVEGYMETVVLMYCDDLKRWLVGEVREEVLKVLGLLKVCCCCAFCFVLIFFMFLGWICWGLDSFIVVIGLLMGNVCH